MRDYKLNNRYMNTILYKVCVYTPCIGQNKVIFVKGNIVKNRGTKLRFEEKEYHEVDARQT